LHGWCRARLPVLRNFKIRLQEKKQMKRLQYLIPCLILIGFSAALSFGEHSESPATQKMAAARKAIDQNPERYDAYNELALAQARRARETADPKYYEDAQRSLETSMRLSPENLEAQRIQVWVLLGKHDFASALEHATALNRRIPDDVMTYAFLTDANVELGNYNEAEKAAQWMLNLRPGNVPGLTRAAFLRELFGDVEGAIDFMQDAYQRTPYSETEDRAWTLTQLAHLHLSVGRLENAERLLTSAFALYPEYHYALANLGKLRTAQGRGEEAIQAFRDLYRVAPHPENLYLLAKALDRSGLAEEAKRTFVDFEQKALGELATTDNSNRELIYYYVDVAHNPAEALRIANIEIARRQDAPTLEAYAWALQAFGKSAEADREIDAALEVGIRDAVSFYHAGVISKASGDTTAAKKYFQQSLETNTHSEVAEAVRHELGGAGE
jgi:tetratricopeptide (TPR) repeat protein